MSLNNEPNISLKNAKSPHSSDNRKVVQYLNSLNTFHSFPISPRRNGATLGTGSFLKFMAPGRDTYAYRSKAESAPDEFYNLVHSRTRPGHSGLPRYRNTPRSNRAIAFEIWISFAATKKDSPISAIVKRKDVGRRANGELRGRSFHEIG